MISLAELRSVLLAPNPFQGMDALVRREMAAGRKVQAIFEDINPLIDEALDTPGITEDGEEALFGSLTALTGECHPSCQYRDEEVAIVALPKIACGDDAPMPVRQAK